MTPSNIKALYTNYCKKHDPEVAFSMLVDKYPDLEGELLAIVDGEDDSLPPEMTFEAPETYFDDKIEPEIVTEAPKKVNETKRPKVTKPKAEKSTAPSKAQQAYDIYAKAVDQSRKAMMKVFIEQLGLTPNGASTYVANCKKKFARQSA